MRGVYRICLCFPDQGLPGVEENCDLTRAFEALNFLCFVVIKVIYLRLSRGEFRENLLCFL